jgi:hypothetical protein
MLGELEAAETGQRSAVMEKYKDMTGKSIQTLYRIAGQNGFQSGRQRRSDRGACRLTDHQVSFVAALIHTSAREVKGPIMDVETALSIAEENNIIEPGSVSVSWMQTLLRRREINRKALKTPEPSIRMRSLHPNHVHVLDASVCIQYYLKGKKGLRMMREDKFYKNKWQNYATIKKRLMRYILADHFSHCLYVKYYYSGGETQENLYDFLLSAWEGGKHDKFPFRGVPFVMLWDKASANVSRAMQAFMERLDVTIPPGLPNNPKRQGSAEVAQNIVESKFESRLRFNPAHTVEDLNDWALDWCVGFNATKKHSRHGMPRIECWLGITAEQLRELPERDMLHYLFARPGEDRLVKNDYFITFAYKPGDRREYRLKHIPGLIPNRTRVQVILRPHHWPEIGVIHNDTEYLVKPVKKVAGGFPEHAAVIAQDFKAQPQTITQKAKQEMEIMAFGEDRAADAAGDPNAVPFKGLKVFGYQADEVDLTYIPKTGRPLSVPGSEFMDKEIAIMEFFNRLRRVMGSISPELNQAIRDAYGSSITLAEAERLIELAREGVLTVENLGTGPAFALQASAGEPVE